MNRIVIGLLLCSACTGRPAGPGDPAARDGAPSPTRADARPARPPVRPDAGPDPGLPDPSGTVPRLDDVKAVPTGGAFYQRPRFTPDGRQLLVTRRRFDGLVLLDPASGRTEEVTPDPGAGWAFDVSPDGRWIAYRAARGDGRRREQAVAVYDRTGHRRRLLTGHARDLGYPFFSPDGAHVLYTDAGRLLRVATSGGAPEVLAPRVPARYLRWLPGRRELLASEDGAVVTLAPDGSGRRVHFQGSGFFGPVIAPALGQYLVHESRGVEGHLWVYDLATQSSRDLGVGHAGGFLPGSPWIVFQRNRNDGRRFLEGDLHAVTLDGRRRAQLTRTADRVEVDPAASPDGRRLAFTDALTGNLFLGRVELR